MDLPATTSCRAIDDEDETEFQRQKAVKCFWLARYFGMPRSVPPQLVIDGGKK